MDTVIQSRWARCCAADVLFLTGSCGNGGISGVYQHQGGRRRQDPEQDHKDPHHTFESSDHHSDGQTHLQTGTKW